GGEVRPRMVAVLQGLKGRYKQACLTNNVRHGGGPGMAPTPERATQVSEIMALFDLVVESSKTGVRKPEPRFYEIACELLQIKPAEAVFLDDLGVNLKPAAAMGMRTIKVGTGVGAPERALAELEAVLGHPLP